jgi:methionine synthase II (cobalamin-independent)
MAMDAAAALNEELRDLQAAGCDVLEIDEPAMTRYHEKVFAYGAKALDRCLEALRYRPWSISATAIPAGLVNNMSTPIQNC